MANINNNEKLLKSVREKQINDVKDCLKKGSLSYSDWAGHSSLHLATMNDDLEIAIILLRNGAPVNQVSKFSKTSLHFACQNGFLEMAKLLIAHGSNLNTLDILKMTPLHWAVERNHIENVRLLCAQKKIDLTKIDVFKRTCLDISIRNGNNEIKNILEEKLNEDKKQIETELEFDNMQKIFQNSTLQKPFDPKLEIENMPGLQEFYKKKSFARTSSSRISRLNSNPNPNMTQSKNVPSISSLGQVQPSTSSAFDIAINSKKNFDDAFDSDSSDEADEEELEEKEIAKRKRLSMSPMNKIDDTLKWIKTQSANTDFSKFDLSLSEAGKLTLDYLNKNDPIRGEKELFLKLVKDLEEEEKCSQEKNNISLNSSPRSDINNIENFDDLLFFE